MGKHTTYFYRPVRFLLYGGVRIYDMENKSLQLLHTIYSILLVAIFGYGYMVTEVIHIYEHSDDMEVVIWSLCFLIAHLMSVGMMLIVSFQRKAIGKLLSALERDEMLPNAERGGAEEQAIIDHAVARTNQQMAVFTTIVFVMISSRLIQIGLNHTHMVYDEATNATVIVQVFPYPSTLPFSTNPDNAASYTCVFVYQSISIILFGLYMGNGDAIVTGLMIHMKAQFKIVTNALLTVADRAERNTDIHPATILERTQAMGVYGERDIDPDLRTTLNANLSLCLNGCIRHHNLILGLLDTMEDIFNKLFLVKFFGGVMILCVSLYQTSLLPITNPLFLSMVCFNASITFQVFIYCWNGNEVSVHSERVADAAYNMRWMNASRGAKLSLVLIMQRAQRVSYFTAGKFSKITLLTFSAIMRGSFSYFMALKQMNEEMEEV